MVSVTFLQPRVLQQFRQSLRRSAVILFHVRRRVRYGSDREQKPQYFQNLRWYLIAGNVHYLRDEGLEGYHVEPEGLGSAILIRDRSLSRFT